MDIYKKKILSFIVITFVGSTFSFNANAFTKEHSTKENVADADSNFNVTPPFDRVLNSAPQSIDFTEVAEMSVNAVVSIKSTVTPKQVGQQRLLQDPFFEFFFGRGANTPAPQPQIGMGSGVIISTDGYIITNNHVVESADKIEVTLNDKRLFNAKIIGSDPATDLALLKVDATDLPMLKFGNSEKLRVGEWVLAVGNPMGLTSTVTAGIVSAKGRTIGTGKSMSIESYIQTDAAVNPGNSGGALVNTDGELVGINTMILSQTGNYIGYSFAVPSNIAIKIVGDLKAYGVVQRALLGISIQEMTAELAKTNSIDFVPGVYVADIVDRGSAMSAGIKKGDIIVAIDGVGIKSVSKLQEEISLHHPGDNVKVSIIRNGDKKDIDVLLKNQQGDTGITKPSDFTSLGVGFKELSTKDKNAYGISAGVEVAGVNAGKFQLAGIRKGFIILNINGETVDSISTIERIYNDILTSDARDKVMFMSGIYPNGRSAYYAVDISAE
ncbi:MAG: Do family serine endopeptidase [Bacteroidales bacterium]